MPATMINDIRIRNFKSIVDLKLPLGRFNVFIGPNGCGKSNILEAISFASAASQNKLDNEFLINRDVRVSEPQFMFNAFEEEDENSKEEGDVVKSIQIEGNADKGAFASRIICHEEAKQWFDINAGIITAFATILNQPIENIDGDERESFDLAMNALKQTILDKLPKGVSEEDLPGLFAELKVGNPDLNRFLIYRPSEIALRKAFETRITPIGVHGEGLLKYLKEAARDGKVDLFREINEGLSLLDWFDSLEIPEDQMQNEYRLNIGDRFLKESLHYFDQRSTNEGFLFLLFYLTLFNSDDTPQFFAVDNIETALNPKLVTKLVRYLVSRTSDKGKQVILTTHNPFVLDSLDLSRDEIRLFVVRRNIDGHTCIERIPYREDRTMPLSQLWMSGLIGGLPDNFSYSHFLATLDRIKSLHTL